MLITIQDSTVSAVIDSIGAQLISVKDAAEKEYIWQRDPKFWSRCSPLLFPIVGNCRNDETVLEGKTWHITKHGFCRDMDFAVTNQTGTSVTFQIRDNEETRAVYPYSFVLSLTYTVKDGSLSMKYQVDNIDCRRIYYCLGAHPGFNCPLEDGSAFEDYVLEFEETENTSSMVYDLENFQFDPSRRGVTLKNEKTIPLKRELFKDDAVYFDCLKSRKVSLVHKATGRGLEMAFPGFETIAFWTPYPGNAPFLCFEPWNGSGVYATEDNEFIHKNHVQQLGVGESKTYNLRIRIL